MAIVFLLVSAAWLFTSNLTPIKLLQGGYVPSEIPKLSINISVEQMLTQKKLISIIEHYSDESDYIYAFPYAPEVYYLSSRKNLFPFNSNMFSVNSEEEYDKILSVIKDKPLNLIIQASLTTPGGTAGEKKFINDLPASGGYVFTESIGEYSIYILKERLNGQEIVPKCWYFGVTPNITPVSQPVI